MSHTVLDVRPSLTTQNTFRVVVQVRPGTKIVSQVKAAERHDPTPQDEASKQEQRRAIERKALKMASSFAQ